MFPFCCYFCICSLFRKLKKEYQEVNKPKATAAKENNTKNISCVVKTPHSLFPHRLDKGGES